MQGSESVSEGLGPYEQACFLHASLHPLKPGSQEPSPGASQSQLEAIHAECVPAGILGGSWIGQVDVEL